MTDEVSLLYCEFCHKVEIYLTKEFEYCFCQRCEIFVCVPGGNVLFSEHAKYQANLSQYRNSCFSEVQADKPEYQEELCDKCLSEIAQRRQLKIQQSTYSDRNDLPM